MKFPHRNAAVITIHDKRRVYTFSRKASYRFSVTERDFGKAKRRIVFHFQNKKLSAVKV